MQVSNPFTAEVLITPTPSRLLLLLIVLTHASAIVVLLLLPGFDVGWRILLSVGVLLSLGYYGCLHGGLWPDRRVKKLYWREFGGWELLTDSGQHLPVILLGSSFSHRYLTVLNFKTRQALGGKRYTVVLLIDNCNREIRRRLRIRIGLLQLANKA